jgi:hypothetical protein
MPLIISIPKYEESADRRACSKEEELANPNW